MKKKIQSFVSYVKTHPKTDLIVLALGLAIYLTITLINAPRASIWFDEAFSAYISQFSFFDIARYTASDVHPPLFYWLFKTWSTLFGTTELAYRSMSIFFGGITTIMAFFLSRKLFGRKVAWLSLLFIVISPMFIRYSDEARMYTLAALIVFSATYVMIRAQETRKKSLWVWYGVLVSLGMWTHYFTALAWLAHWAWWGMQRYQKGMKVKEFLAAIFTREWLTAYITAVALFLPWLPFMLLQLGIVQGGGFWIGPVGVDTPVNYLSNYFYYLDHGQAQGWLALAIVWVAVAAFVAFPRAYKALTKAQKKSFLLISALAWVPPMLLFLASMPPLRSSFVERYLIPSMVALSIFLAVVLTVGTQKWKPFWRVAPIVLIAGMMVFGITNVYKYGNFNKNSNTHILTKEVVQKASQDSPVGTPIVANSPWVFYEAVAYSTKDHPVYFIDKNTDYEFGSLDMLKYNDQHKIKDLAAFEKEHPTFWYIGNTSDDDVAPYESSWKKITTVSEQDNITGNTIYKATEYTVTAE